MILDFTLTSLRFKAPIETNESYSGFRQLRMCAPASLDIAANTVVVVPATKVAAAQSEPIQAASVGDNGACSCGQATRSSVPEMPRSARGGGPGPPVCYVAR